MEDEYEFARFGEGWLFRIKGSADDWEPCDVADVPTVNRMKKAALAIGTTTNGHSASASGTVSARIIKR